MFSHALRNSSGRLHQWIMDTLSANALSPAADYLYDRNVCSGVRFFYESNCCADFFLEECWCFKISYKCNETSVGELCFFEKFFSIKYNHIRFVTVFFYKSAQLCINGTVLEGINTHKNY